LYCNSRSLKVKTTEFSAFIDTIVHLPLAQQNLSVGSSA
jgi:hypothetical protein